VSGEPDYWRRIYLGSKEVDITDSVAETAGDWRGIIHLFFVEVDFIEVAHGVFQDEKRSEVKYMEPAAG